MSVFGDLERFASDLYPYRWPITIAAATLLIAAVAFAYRRGWHHALWRHRLASSAIVAPILAIAIPAGWYTLSPLWERSHLEEASQLEAATVDAGPFEAAPPVIESAHAPDSSNAPATPTESPFMARITHRGQFQGADDFHFGRGQAQLIERVPGRYTLRFEDFSVRNGPTCSCTSRLMRTVTPMEPSTWASSRPRTAHSTTRCQRTLTSHNSGAPLSGANASQSCSLRPRWNRYNRRS